MYAIDVSRRGIYEEPTGVKMIRPGRFTPRRIPWSEIERFEARSGAGQSPVTLIRAPDHQAIAVPTFARPRRAIQPKFKKYHTRVQVQVDELNAVLAAHQAKVIDDGPTAAHPR
ncbi:MAG TPA: hypothetical protein VHV75_15165 [Solirubrobacteraceae bacterium]|nr:hypothetical protein [Solirubrobacteraceae bacterium]